MKTCSHLSVFASLNDVPSTAFVIQRREVFQYPDWKRKERMEWKGRHVLSIIFVIFWRYWQRTTNTFVFLSGFQCMCFRLYFVIVFISCFLCCLCNWPYGCCPSILIRKNWIIVIVMFFWALNLVHLRWTLLVYEFPLGTSETFLCFMLVHPIQTVPPAGVQLPQIQFVINWMSLEGKLSHLDVILLYYIITRCHD
jgi:hypothetical protein